MAEYLILFKITLPLTAKLLQTFHLLPYPKVMPPTIAIAAYPLFHTLPCHPTTVQETRNAEDSGLNGTLNLAFLTNGSTFLNELSPAPFRS